MEKNELKKFYIYGLVDPTDDKVKYVGCSINTKIRYRKHLYEAKNKKLKKEKWINDLLEKGIKPILTVIDTIITTNRTEALNLERKYIEENAKNGLNSNKNVKKKTTSFYIDEQLLIDIRTYCAYSKTPFSEVVNTALIQWYNINNTLIEKSIKQSKELDELINSYKNKTK